MNINKLKKMSTITTVASIVVFPLFVSYSIIIALKHSSFDYKIFVVLKFLFIIGVVCFGIFFQNKYDHLLEKRKMEEIEKKLTKLAELL